MRHRPCHESATASWHARYRPFIWTIPNFKPRSEAGLFLVGRSALLATALVGDRLQRFSSGCTLAPASRRGFSCARRRVCGAQFLHRAKKGGWWDLATLHDDRWSTTASVSRETASKQNPVGGIMLRRGSVLSARYNTEESSRAMRKASACHLKVLPSARSPTLVRKMAPLCWRGQGGSVMQRRWLTGRPAPCARPQSASVELVP